MDILDDMGVSKLSAKVFLKVNYSFNNDRSEAGSLKRSQVILVYFSVDMKNHVHIVGELYILRCYDELYAFLH